MSFGRIRKPILWISLAINLAFFIIILTPLTEELYKPLIVDEPLKKSGVIVILSCGHHESGMLGFRTLVRLTKGLELYRAGWADKIICAGGNRYGNTNRSIAEAMKDTLVLYGVPAKDVFTQDNTKNTYNDINGLIQKYRGRFDFNRAIFVTSSYHTFRMKRILMKKNIKALVVSGEEVELHPIHATQRLDSFREVVREYGAICYFWLKGWI
jgi:uncharacterized SAM-binding protein YcdF (DUF218 family)